MESFLFSFHTFVSWFEFSQTHLKEAKDKRSGVDAWERF